MSLDLDIAREVLTDPPEADDRARLLRVCLHAAMAELDRLAFRDAAHAWLGPELLAVNVGEQVPLVKA